MTPAKRDMCSLEKAANGIGPPSVVMQSIAYLTSILAVSQNPIEPRGRTTTVLDGDWFVYVPFGTHQCCFVFGCTLPFCRRKHDNEWVGWVVLVLQLRWETDIVKALSAYNDNVHVQ